VQQLAVGVDQSGGDLGAADIEDQAGRGHQCRWMLSG
jgi:hypothetical protein